MFPQSSSFSTKLKSEYAGIVSMYAGVVSPIDSRSRSTLKMSSSPQQFNRGSRPSAPPPPINQFIRADKVRLIVPGNDTGDEVMLGIFSLADALIEAEKFQMDLVMINDKGDPPVCKVIDYGKYKYSLEKKKKENLKKQVNVDIKEVKMSYKIDQHDFDVRMRAVRKFLGDGDKVRDSSNCSTCNHLEISSMKKIVTTRVSYVSKVVNCCNYNSIF